MISMLMDRRRLFILNWIYSREERRFCIYEPCHSKKASERERERERERSKRRASYSTTSHTSCFRKEEIFFPRLLPLFLLHLLGELWCHCIVQLLLILQQKSFWWYKNDKKKNHFSSFSSSLTTGGGGLNGKERLRPGREWWWWW